MKIVGAILALAGFSLLWLACRMAREPLPATIAAQERTAAYVREHKCPVVSVDPGYTEWNYAYGNTFTAVGRKYYKCPEIKLWIFIKDNEVQP